MTSHPGTSQPSTFQTQPITSQTSQPTTFQTTQPTTFQTSQTSQRRTFSPSSPTSLEPEGEVRNERHRVGTGTDPLKNKAIAPNGPTSTTVKVLNRTRKTELDDQCINGSLLAILIALILMLFL
eukprot:TRINITY_DN958_c0_g2_i5.p1 TRINITY_DN958_c0_g2~~TRINITY_DN958_c0_g2_i5.p1  ORF type:complete len:124 (-),score=14.32 TRINITY_DN958_c0_g2_i5:132-503(-)